MNQIGFLISHKNGERRRAVLPGDLKANVRNINYCCFEQGYGSSLGISDEEYLKIGAKIVSREEALSCPIITDVKLGDADYLSQLEKGKVLFGWAHAIQGVSFTSSILTGLHTVIAWEEMYENGRYLFYRNREIAGESAVMQAFRYCGKMPYDTTVAILGNGQTAKGAMRILHGLGANVDVYGRKHEKLFREKMYQYDVLINCIMWDTSRKDRIIYREDLSKLKKGCMIIDISCDPYLEIETSHPTTISDPVYEVDGVIHYAVDNTPAMYPVTVTRTLSKEIAPCLDLLIEKEWIDYNELLKKATVIRDGLILDERICAFRKARGLFCQ